MLFILDLNFSNQGSDPQNKPPKTEVPSGNNGNDSGKENPSDEEKPAPEEPVDETPADPEPSEPEEIVIPENGTVDYKVAAGDTLWSIAMRAGVTAEKIKQWNNLTSNTIYVGQILTLYGKNVEPPPPQDPPAGRSTNYSFFRHYYERKSSGETNPL